MKRETIIILAVLIICFIVGGVCVTKLSSSAKVKSNIELGNKYLEEGKYQEAILAFEKVIAIDPKNVEARIGLSKVYKAQGRVGDAEKLLKECIDIKKNNPTPYLELAKLHMEQGRFSDAMKILTKGYEVTKDKKIKAMIQELKSKVTLDDLKETVSVGTSFTLPGKVRAKVDGKDVELPVSWSSTAVDTSHEGTYSCQGTIEDYDIKVNLTVSVKAVNSNNTGNIAAGSFIVEMDDYYYFDCDDAIYRIRKDNYQNAEKLRDETNYSVIYFNTDGSYIYYISYDWRTYSGLVKKMSPDGKSVVTLATDASRYLSLVDGQLYYINDSGYIITMDTEGKNPRRIGGDKVLDVSIYGDWIYYLSASDTVEDNPSDPYGDHVEKSQLGRIYRIRKDGTGNQRICSDGAYTICADEDYVYYSSGSDSVVVASEGMFYAAGKLYRVKSDGSASPEKLADETVNNINIQEEWVYLRSNYNYWRLNKATLQAEDIAQTTYSSPFVVLGSQWFAHDLNFGELLENPRVKVYHTGENTSLCSFEGY